MVVQPTIPPTACKVMQAQSNAVIVHRCIWNADGSTIGATKETFGRTYCTGLASRYPECSIHWHDWGKNTISKRNYINGLAFSLLESHSVGNALPHKRNERNETRTANTQQKNCIKDEGGNPR